MRVKKAALENYSQLYKVFVYKHQSFSVIELEYYVDPGTFLERVDTNMAVVRISLTPEQT